MLTLAGIQYTSDLYADVVNFSLSLMVDMAEWDVTQDTEICILIGTYYSLISFHFVFLFYVTVW